MNRDLLQLAEDKMSEARCLLISVHPAYGFAALKIQFQATFDKTDTACIAMNRDEIRFYCFVNAKFIKPMSISEVAFVICHEIEHLIRAHLFRDTTNMEDRELMNIAADMTIHGYKSNPKIGIRSSSGIPLIPKKKTLVWVPDDWYPDLTMEEFYVMLLKEKQKEKQKADSPSASGKGSIGSGNPLPASGGLDSNKSNPDSKLFGKVFDDHSFWGADSASGLGEELIKTLVHEVNQAVGQGDIPGHWQSVINNVLAPKVSWQSLLREYISDIYRRTQHPSILRRSRRHRWFGAPGRRKDESRHIVIVVDTSGSVSNEMLERFFSEIDSATDHANLDLLLWDASLQGFYENYKARQWKERIKIKGRGGTDMRTPIMWLQEKKVKANCYIVLTDGFCNWPEQIPTPVIGVIASSGWSDLPPHIRNGIPPHIRNVVISKA